MAAARERERRRENGGGSSQRREPEPETEPALALLAPAPARAIRGGAERVRPRLGGPQRLRRREPQRHDGGGARPRGLRPHARGARRRVLRSHGQLRLRRLRSALVQRARLHAAGVRVRRPERAVLGLGRLAVRLRGGRGRRRQLRRRGQQLLHGADRGAVPRHVQRLPRPLGAGGGHDGLRRGDLHRRQRRLPGGPRGQLCAAPLPLPSPRSARC